MLGISKVSGLFVEADRLVPIQLTCKMGQTPHVYEGTRLWVRVPGMEIVLDRHDSVVGCRLPDSEVASA